MDHTKQPANDFRQLYDEIKSYFSLQSEYVKVELVEKLTILLSALLISGLILILSLAVLFYLCFALAYALQTVVGSLALSFVLISLIYVLLIVLLLVFRKKWVINPLVRFLSVLFLKDDMDKTDF